MKSQDKSLFNGSVGTITFLAFVFFLLVSATFFSFKETYMRANEVIETIYLGQGIYRLEMLPESSANAEEKSLVKFRTEHPKLRMVAVYTLQEHSDKNSKIILIITEQK